MQHVWLSGVRRAELHRLTMGSRRTGEAAQGAPGVRADIGESVRQWHRPELGAALVNLLLKSSRRVRVPIMLRKSAGSAPSLRPLQRT